MLEDIFNGLKAYAGSWEVANVRSLNNTEKNLVEHAEIVVSDYGYSCCFFMKNGIKKFIPMDKDYTGKSVGEVLDIDRIEIVEYVCEGQSPIKRVRERTVNTLEDIFNGLKAYAGSWKVVSVRPLNIIEKYLIRKAKIINSDFGKSCCFYTKLSIKKIIPMDINYTAKGVGEFLDLDKIEIVKYVREGESPIKRVREKSSDLKSNTDTLENKNVHSSNKLEKPEKINSESKGYSKSWEVANVRSLNNTEKNLVKRAEIVVSDYGYSCCFFMKNGRKTFIPMDKDYTGKSVGEVLDIDRIEIVKYVRDGDSPINRIREKSSDLKSNTDTLENKNVHSSNKLEKPEKINSESNVYSKSWKMASVHSLTDTEKSLMRKAEIISSDYGNSCCFFMKNGTKTFIPMDKNYTAKGVGELLDLDKIEIVKYVRDGHSPINRIREKQ